MGARIHPHRTRTSQVLQPELIKLRAPNTGFQFSHLKGHLMNTPLAITLIAIEGAGLLIIAGFGFAIYREAKKAKLAAEAAKKKAQEIATATRRFLGEIDNILGN
jgi:hypothetical protein